MSEEGEKTHGGRPLIFYSLAEMLKLAAKKAIWTIKRYVAKVTVTSIQAFWIFNTGQPANRQDFLLVDLAVLHPLPTFPTTRNPPSTSPPPYTLIRERHASPHPLPPSLNKQFCQSGFGER